MDIDSLETLRVQFQGNICFTEINRPANNNTINKTLILELSQLLAHLTNSPKTVMVLQGSADIFCQGADFDELVNRDNPGDVATNANSLFDAYNQLSTSSLVTVAHIEGSVNAGGIGLIAASDIVIASDAATFGLSELLFDLLPACVMPFLIRRIGFQKANYLTLLSKPVSAHDAYKLGLVDTVAPNSKEELRKHLLRLRPISKKSITQYKQFTTQLYMPSSDARNTAVAANQNAFSDAMTLAKIDRFVNQGVPPWEIR